MQQLIIFLGEKGSEKDQLFKLLPMKEIVFEKLLIKERIDKSDKQLIFINFPEENEITQAIHSLLALSKYFTITQIVFCLHYVQSFTQRVQHIQKKFNEVITQEVENIYTFFISNCPWTLQKNINRIYQFSKIDELNKQNFIRILEDIYTNKNTYIPQTMLQQKEQLQQSLSILNKQFQEEYLTTNSIVQLESKVQMLFSNEMQPLNKPNIEIQDKNIKQNEITLYSDAIQQLYCKKYEQIQQLNKLQGWFYKFWYCNNCKILYQKQGNKFIIYELSLFSFNQINIDIQKRDYCYRCQQYLTQQKQTIILYFLQIYIFKQIKNNLKTQGQFQVDTKKQITQERMLNIKNKKDCIAILLLSDEDELTQFVMQQVYERKNYKEKNQFQEGDILNDSFYLIDSPIFQFDEDSEELESIYSNYLNTNPIHFIIFCLKLQRSNLIKQTLLSMLKKLPNINKQAFGVFIMNQNSDVQIEQSFEQEITNSIKGLITQTILIQNNNTSKYIIKKISDFINNVDKTKQISFEHTIFHKQGNEQNQEQIEKSLILISQNISDKYIVDCQQEIKDEEKRQENLELEKQQLQQQITNLNSEFSEKQKELTNLIKQIQQELREQERIYRENVNNLNNKIHQSEMDYNSSIINLGQKKRQLNQMEIEKIKKRSNLNQNRINRYN